MRQRFPRLVTGSMRQRRAGRAGWPWRPTGQGLPARLLRRPEEGALGPRAGAPAPRLPQPPPRGPGRRRRGSQPLVMEAAAGGVAAPEAAAGLDEQTRLERVVLLLAALPGGLVRRVVGADAPPCRPGMGQRGAAGAAAGPAPPGAGPLPRRDHGPRQRPRPRSAVPGP